MKTPETSPAWTPRQEVELVAAIVEAVPEIKSIHASGCQILVSTVEVTGTDFDGIIPDDNKTICTVLSFDPGGYNGEDYDGETMKAWSHDWNHCYTFRDELPEYEILGRPITLDDVLRMYGEIQGPIVEQYEAENKFYEPWGCDEEVGKLLHLWELGKPLSDQSQPTKQFLHQLLCRDSH